MSISRIAFLEILQFEDGNTYRGAVLLTQEKTVPLEFYLTDPLQPNPIQKVLYGAIFQDYLKFEVFGKPLLSNLSTKPDVVLVRESGLLNLIDSSEIPLALMQEGNKVEKLVSGKNFEDQILKKEIESISQENSLYEPFERVNAAVMQIHEQQNGVPKKRLA